ncbi:hypothetical protein ACH40E_01210 [Streptomyces acidicola]|uniref:hypothetical protein n=1 Tax=Streptomyces acidicola TaxID=2596892 RepID=UPI00379BC383
MRSGEHGKYIADPARLGRCTEQMRALSEEVTSMFDDFQQGVHAFRPWTGDGTERNSLEFQLGWDKRNGDIGEIGISQRQAVVGMVDATLVNLRSIEGASEFAQDEIRDHRSQTEGVMDDLDTGSGSGSDSRH